MRKIHILTFALAGAATLTSCSKMGALSADNFTVTPTPLEAVGGEVPFTINGKFPEKYLKKKAVITVTPVLRYAGGQSRGSGASFQGESVEGNDQTISHRIGGHYTMKGTFAYTPEMSQSDLYATFTAKVGNKPVAIPDVKISYGVLATAELLSRTLATNTAAQAPDGYERTRKLKQEASIKFLIQQANLRGSELNSSSIRQFIQTLKDINSDPTNKSIENVEVSAYASPDGPTQLNTKLAQAREDNSANYVNKQLQANNMKTYVDTKYTAEDWDGFQELVAQSKLQDKELILRVLSMYNDPEERERQIRNISTVYKELADEILPQLRRARLAINYKLVGRSDEQIVATFNQTPSQLSAEELLYGGNTLMQSKTDKRAWYQSAVEIYPNDYRGYNNLAKLAYEDGNTDMASSYLQKAQVLNQKAPEVNANLALLALKDGNISEAENLLGKSVGAPTFKEMQGCLNIAKGNYAQAAADMDGTPNSNSAGLAYLLNKDYDMANATLISVPNADGVTDYLKAIVAARTTDADGVREYLGNAIRKDPTLASRAIKDAEFTPFKDMVNQLTK